MTVDHAARDVSIVCTPVPPELIPADTGRSGGKGRWWVATSYGTSRWSRRGGYLTADVPPADRTPGPSGSRFTVRLAPGVRYCFGIGLARYEVTLPPGDWQTLTVQPCDQTRALVYLAGPERPGAPPLLTTIDTDPHDDINPDTIPF